MPARLVALLAAASVPLLAAARPAEGDVVSARLAAATAALARDAGSPRAIVPLTELAELEGALPDLGPLAAAYARAADDRGAHPEIRALARHALAGLERQRGNLQRAAAHERRLGFVTGWTVLGPFDGEGRRGHDAVFPPEERLDLSGRWPGKAREVSWRPLPEAAQPNGFVHLGAALRPAREVVAYALAVVESAGEARAVLRAGASGATKIWVNGALAIADPGYHVARLDQRAAEVSLRRGPNVILVKLSHEAGRMGFWLRLTDGRGDPARVRPLPAPPPAAALAATAGAAPAPVDGVVTLLERRVAAAVARRAHAEEAQARYDLAVALDARGLRTFGGADRAALESRRAAELAPRRVEARLLAARLEENGSRRREHLAAALAAAPDEPRALLALAREESAQGRPHDAVRLLDRAVAAAPAYVAAIVARLEAREAAGQPARAAREAAEVADRFPAVPEAVAAAAHAARRLRRVEQAALLLRKLVALRFDDAAARASLAHLLLERGDLDGFVALQRETLRLDPADPAGWVRLGEVLAANGRSGDEAFAQAIAIAPEDADAFERRGRAHLAAGRTAEAARDLQEALELRPQSPELKELVRSLEPARERFERPYVLDALALAKAARPPRAGDDAVVLGELKVTRVFPSGLSSTFEQVVVKVATARGAEQARRRTLSWAPDRQEVRVVRARVIKPDGTTVEAYDEQERSTSEPWYRLYYDTRAKTLTFPALAPGDVLDVAWRVDDVAGENLLSDYFGDVTYLEGGTRKERFDYVLLVPAARPIHANEPEGVTHEKRTLEGGVVEHRFTARDLPRLVPEPMMPGWSEISRHVHVSTYASWDQVARFYWGLVREQLRPTDEVRATAARIAADVVKARGGTPGVRLAREGEGAAAGWDEDTALAVVKALYDFVVTDTRYVGLEFGIHGFKPYRVDQVLSRRFGDCKDKASLLHALLESVGIDSRLVLLRMRRLGRMPEKPASLAIFNHAILYVPRFDLWLDGTASYSGSRDLPGEDRDATVLVVEPDGPPRFGRVPEARPDDNRSESVFEVALAADGSATLRGRARVAGAQAPGYRRAYETEGERRTALEQAFNRTFPGLEVKRLALSDLSRIEDDVTLEFELQVPRYAQADGGGLRFAPFGGAAGYTEAYAATSSRRHDLVLGEPSDVRFTYRYALPPGWAVAEAPEDAGLETSFGSFAVRYREEGGALVAEGHVRLAKARVAAEDYAAFRRFTAGVDRAFGRRVRVAPAAAQAEGGAR